MYETSDFLNSIITFSYAKYFVHSYTVDVVYTLSYLHNTLMVILAPNFMGKRRNGSLQWSLKNRYQIETLW